MPIIYSLVSRGAIVLAEHASSKGNFTTVARRILEKLPATAGQNQKMSYVYDKHLFHYVIDGDLVFLCMAEEDFGRSIPFAFLEDIKNRFRATYGNRGSTAPPLGMNADFARVLQNQMDYYSQSKNVDKIANVKGKIEEVKTVMVENIENVLKRGERIELLVDRTEHLESSAIHFRQSATTLKRAMWWKNVKLMAILGCVVIFAIYFIVAIACGGLSLPKCHKKSSDSTNSTTLASTAMNSFNNLKAMIGISVDSNDSSSSDSSTESNAVVPTEAQSTDSDAGESTKGDPTDASAETDPAAEPQTRMVRREIDLKKERRGIRDAKRQAKAN